MTLECQITGHPTPVVLWFREDYQIESSIDFQVSYKDGFARMVIREAFAEDSGRFSCTATSEAGTISTSCFLLVKGDHQEQVSEARNLSVTGPVLPVCVSKKEKSYIRELCALFDQ